MPQQYFSLPKAERQEFEIALAFLHNRMCEWQTLEWALGLTESEIAKRQALLYAINTFDGRKLPEPWRSAWRLIEEGWSSQMNPAPGSLDVYGISERIKNGERTGALIADIVNLVKPVINVANFSKLLPKRKIPRRPKSVNDLMSVSITSGEIIDPVEFGINGIEEKEFLIALAHELEAAIRRCLDIGQRLGWDVKHSLWRYGELYRVYFVSPDERQSGETEPDEFNKGIAPSVKLLHTVVARLGCVSLDAAIPFIRRWRETPGPIYLRLWAAFARDANIASAFEIGEFFASLDDNEFWDLQSYPEISELRACRFAGVSLLSQRSIESRLRKGPPRSFWLKNAEREKVSSARLYWAVRELKRIIVVGGHLSTKSSNWLSEQIKQFDDLQHMTRNEGYRGSPKVRWIQSTSDDSFDLLSGVQRLSALEMALSSRDRVWVDGSLGTASGWIQKPDNIEKILTDFESTTDGGADYPNVWDRFGWTYSLSNPVYREGIDSSKLKAIAQRVLALLEILPDRTLGEALDGISYWFYSWGKYMAGSPRGAAVWQRLWPIAVEATNAQQVSELEPELNVVARVTLDQEPMDLDTLNTPAGKLVEAFFEACPQVTPNKPRPFNNLLLRAMRDTAISAEGRSGLIVHFMMIERLGWFLVADENWAKSKLLKPLQEESSEALTLWRAVAHRTHFSETLNIIGKYMAERVLDLRLSRDTRQSLAFSLVVESLHAFREDREPVVPNSQVQQILRLLDDEVRASVAEVVQRFVRDVSAPSEFDPKALSPEALFHKAALPFLRQVWPQERSLVRPGVAKAFADLPATCGEAFAQAVDAIEPFLVPFQCWSMLDYGLYGDENGISKLSIINDELKAEAFLRLLQATVATSEGATVPTDLGNALEQIKKIAPKLAETQSFRRLATLTRR